MAKQHHSELKDLQKVYKRLSKRRGSIFGNFKRPDGTPLTGVDITYLGCFRSAHRSAQR